MSDIDTAAVDSLKVLDPNGRLEKRHHCSAHRSDAEGQYPNRREARQSFRTRSLPAPFWFATETGGICMGADVYCLQTYIV